MKIIACLLEIELHDPATSTTKTIRVTNRNDPRATGFNNQEWRPILSLSPTISQSVFNGAFTGVGTTTLGPAEISLLDGDIDEWARYAWHGAKVKVFVGDMATGVYPQVFTAFGNGASRKGRTSLAIELKTLDEYLEQNLLYLSYSGSGDIEGTADLTGVLKPFVFGDAKFCKPVLIDPVRQIYQMHGYGPVESVYSVFEGGALIGTGGAPAATYSGTYAEFRDAAVALGEWIRHNNLGLIKLGSQPSFPVSCHVKGDTGGVAGGTMLTKTGAVIKRMVNMVTPSVTVKTTSAAAFDVAQPQPMNDFLDTQISVKEAITKLLLGLGAYWSWNEVGELILGRVRFGGSMFTLSGDHDQEPEVVGISQMPTSSPVWALRLTAEECHFVHDASDLTGAVQALAQEIINISDLANSKNKTFQPSATPPTGAVDGDLWPDTSTDPATLRRYNASTGTWVTVSSVNYALLVQWSVDGSTGWHTDFAIGDQYLRQSLDNGATWQPAIKVVGEDGAEGDFIQYVFQRSATAPATPTGNGIPSGWFDAPPASPTTQPVWISAAKQTAAGVLITGWSVPIKLTGDTGAAGNYKQFAYIRSASQPATPTGNNIPSGWSAGLPTSGTNPVWMSTAEQITGTGVTVGSWSTPVRITGDAGPQGPTGSTGSPGRDAVVFYQDATPSGAIAGDTWITVTSNIFRRYNGSAWEQLLGDVAALNLISNAYIAVLAVGTANMQDLAVTTLKVAGGAITAPQATTGGDVTISVGVGAQDVVTSATKTVGDSNYGSALIIVFAEMDTNTNIDTSCEMSMYVSVNGGGYALQKITRGGIHTEGGSTNFKLPFAFAFLVTGCQTVSVNMKCEAVNMPNGSGAQAFYIRSPTIVVLGAQR